MKEIELYTGCRLLAASALYGFVLPLVELTYKTANQKVNYTLVMDIQIDFKISKD
ncbi:hypothetical protein Ddye_006388 [Dipteronia dyeriana]|uniref:Uncharacterized protein n=1 Tax=Dipteronia dyeriana TaxID=168575 RepID=A0AAD9XIA3_9ROSI|nr:hypothetical protein Ddye_006388 [Dipteronia dyeriana]